MTNKEQRETLRYSIKRGPIGITAVFQATSSGDENGKQGM